MLQGRCFSCKKEISFAERVVRKEECPHCRADVHVCLNCRHYDPGAYNECKEPSAERCTEKEKSNFCDYFDLSAGSAASDPAADLKAAAEALFKK